MDTVSIATTERHNKGQRKLTETIRVTEILVADDTQLTGHDKEVDGGDGGKEITTTAINIEEFEEMCHEDREEHKILEQQAEIRLLGSYSDRATDIKKKIGKDEKTDIQREKVAKKIQNPQNSSSRGGRGNR